MKVNRGFTLAEVLVTVGLIGLIAAITIPALINSTPDKNKFMFKKAYYSLNKAINAMVTDETDYPTDLWDNLADLPRGFNYTDQTTNSVTISSVTTVYNKFCYLLMKNLNTTGSNGCIKASDTGISTFTTSDGMTWNIYTPMSDTSASALVNTGANKTTGGPFPLNASSYDTLITIDVNGPKTGNNNGPDCSYTALSNPSVNACGANVTPDIFRIGVRYDGRLQINPNDTFAINAMSDQTKITK